jgi:hypothetical protein
MWVLPYRHLLLDQQNPQVGSYSIPPCDDDDDDDDDSNDDASARGHFDQTSIERYLCSGED